MESLTEEMTCQTCGGLLASGPFGLRCARCVLSLVEDVGSEEDSYVAELFPELRLEEQVAKGGFGAVYRAQHRKMRRPVALKFLDTVLARNPEAVALFEQEMISVGGLDHPGIVRAHDAGERDGHWYIVMEFVDGLDCGALVRKHGHLPVAESCEIIRQAAVALGHAHGKGLVHRDVKPGNVMVSRGEGTKGMEETQKTAGVPEVLSVPLVPASVKVLDFGLAGLAVAPVFSQPVSTGGSTLFLGTLEYISPEQIESPDKVDARADIYSLGATLWRLLTGKTPHGGASPEMSLFVAMKRITSEPVPSLATVRPDLPKPLIQLCDAMLSLDREKRPASAAEVALLLEPWCARAELLRLFTDGPLEEKPFVFPRKNRRPLWAAAAAVVVAAGIGVAAFLAGNAAPPPAPAAPELEGVAVFSKTVARFHDIPAQNMPRLLSTEWVVEREHLGTETFTKVDMARLRSDGRLMWIHTGDKLIIEPKSGGDWEEVKQLSGINKFGVQPETGNMVWAPTTHPDDLTIHRILSDGARLAPLAPDFSNEGTAEARRAMKAERQAKGNEDGCAYVSGIAFVTENTLPPGSGLSPGDVLYADEGHRDLYAILDPYPNTHGTDPGLWKFRFDADEPAQRLGSLPGQPKKDDAYFPLDVTVSRHGAFLLNRTNLLPSGQAIPADSNARVFRLEAGTLHPCTTDQPILSPAGIAADPLSADLFVLDGGAIVQPGVMEQRVLRLRPAGPDRYCVETFARKFRGFSYCGLQITDDGQRMVITDEKLMSVVVLKRGGIEPAPADDAQKSTSEIPLTFPGWEHASSLEHREKFTSPRFAPGGRVLYCKASQLRIVSADGGVADNFLKPGELEGPAFSGVSLRTGDVAWAQTKDAKSPSIGRASPDGKLLPALKFTEPAPPLPGSFAFVTAANLPANTALRPGDALVVGSRHPQHPQSTSGLWRFRFENDEPPARLVAVSDAAVKDVTLSKAGVFLLTESGLQRWDGSALYPITTSEPLRSPIALAADPLSSDLFLLEPGRLLRLRPGSADTFTAEVLTTAITEATAAGLCFSADGKRLLIGDYGRKKTWVLKRK